MKKLINHPDNVVEEMVEGLVGAFPGLRRIAGHTVLVRSDLPAMEERPVAVICGGGSGHEPAHAGYVGRGMLAAAVAGAVFTSPAPDSVFAAIRATAGPMGALLIVKNYTGDRLNFGLAAEMARGHGIPVEMVLVADDVALAASVEKEGRRGLAGTLFVQKVAGALAEQGAGLDEVASAAGEVAKKVQTMGVALTPCTVPAAGKPTFELGEQEIELGLGIHGEPGVSRTTIKSADHLVDQLMESVLAHVEPGPGQRVVLLVNNLGAAPTMEIAIVARRAIQVLQDRGLTLERVCSGTFLTALEMSGASLTVLPVTSEELALLDAPTEAPAWPAAAFRPRSSQDPLKVALPEAGRESSGNVSENRILRIAMEAAAKALIDNAPELTRMDQAVGDGDLGITLERGAKAILEALPSFPWSDPGQTLQSLGLTLQRSMGGTSGPLYAVFFLRAAKVLSEAKSNNAISWASAFKAGCDAIAELGGARLGSRTMLDALIPAAEAFQMAIAEKEPVEEALQKAVKAAEEGCKATATMAPKTGRSSYLGDRAIGHPDPGAKAVVVWLNAIWEVHKNQ